MYKIKVILLNYSMLYRQAKGTDDQSLNNTPHFRISSSIEGISVSGPSLKIGTRYIKRGEGARKIQFCPVNSYL